MRAAATLALALAVAAGSLHAQFPQLPPLGRGWIDVSYPKLFYAGSDGVTFGLYAGQILPLTFDEYFSPPPYRAALTLNGEISTSGSKSLRLDARLPQAADGWRFVISLAGQRSARERYFGIGNQSVYDSANETDAQPHFYRSDRIRLYARGEVQRRIVGPVRLLAGFHAERWKVDTLPGPSQLAIDRNAGAVPSIGRYTGEISVRIGLVVDTRDNEVAPSRGVLVQGIYGVADSSVAGSLSYTRATVSAAGYLPLGQRVIVSGRLVGQSMGGNPGVGTLYLMEASDQPYRGLGGARSHRALRTNRLLGEDKLLANFDVRFTLYDSPTILRVSLLGFLDAGRVFQDEDFRLTTDDLQVGAGGGLFIHMFRNAILGFTVGGGAEGAVAKFHSVWTY